MGKNSKSSSKKKDDKKKDDKKKDNKKKDDKSKSKSKSKSSSKDNDKFKAALKKAGTWNSFQNLSPDQQEFIKYNWTTLRSDSKEAVKQLEKATKEATEQADPYWKGFLNVAQDEISRAVDSEKQQATYQKSLLETRIKEIGEDLTKNKDFYTLEQQSDLAKLKMSYEQQRDGVIEDAASKGLTFSTNREKPLQQLEEYNTNVVESTNRNYNKKIGDLEIESQRGIVDAQGAIKRIDETTNEKIIDIGREGEKQLGSENVNIDGYAKLGGVTGEMYENKVKDIEERKQGILAENTQKSLTF